MLGSGIIESVINYEKSSKNNATHFVICNGEKLRYFISLKNGKKYLVNNISSYSSKLSIMLNLIKFAPFFIIELFGFGYFVKSDINKNIKGFINQISNDSTTWNAIIGTYDEKQKIVIQVCDKMGENLYFKIGNESSNKEILSEIQFLDKKINYYTFNVPVLVASQKMEDGNKFNIQVTKEFSGEKVEPILNDEIYRIFKEITNISEKKELNNIVYTFSHGDFAPWNMKKKDGKYIVFDWEHCGFRFYGFDLIHYLFQVENLLNNKSKEESIELAIIQFNKLEGKEIYSKELLKHMYFEEYKKSY